MAPTFFHRDPCVSLDLPAITKCPFPDRQRNDSLIFATKRNMTQEFSTSATDGAIILKLVHSGWHAAAGKGDRPWQPMFYF